MKQLLLAALLTLFGLQAFAIDKAPAFQDPVQQTRYERLSRELRCLVCRSETIADSNAQLAVDLRRQLRELMAAGKSDQEIMTYMTDRFAGQPGPRDRPGRRPASTPPWWRPDARTTPTRSTTCWRSPGCSGACWTPGQPDRRHAAGRRRGGDRRHGHRRRAERELHHPERLPRRRARRGRHRGAQAARGERRRTGPAAAQMPDPTGCETCASVTCWSPPRAARPELRAQRRPGARPRRERRPRRGAQPPVHGAGARGAAGLDRLARASPTCSSRAVRSARTRRSAVGASTTYGNDPNVEPVGFRRLYDDVGIVDLDTPTEIVAPSAERGCGSSPGTPGGARSSCAAEIAEGSWYVVPSVPGGPVRAGPAGALDAGAAPPAGRARLGLHPPADPTLN